MVSAREPARGGDTEPEINQELSSYLIAKTVNDLISTSYHALDEIKVKLTKSAQPEPDPELFVGIVADKAGKSLTIVDNGVGMTRSGLFRHGGAVARYGTEGFMEALLLNADAASMFGFGIGPLSAAYLVADKVVITTKHDDDDQQYQYVWAGGSFSVKPDAAGERLGRGTQITLFLKESHLECLAERRLEDLVDKYPGSIDYPIYLCAEEKEEDEAVIRIEALEVTENKDDDNAKLYDSSTTSSSCSSLTCGDEDSDSDSENEDEEEDSGRLAGRTHSTSSGGGGDDTTGVNDCATSAVVEGQMGLPVPEHQPEPRNMRASAAEPGPGPGPGSSSSSFTPLFKRATAGRCYRCLAPDHFVASCTFPRRCLLCYCTSHVARDCALLPYHEYHGPGAPHRRLDWVAACAPFSDAMMKAPAAAVSPPAPPPLLYRARVCIEGVPAHARQLGTVAGLFAGGGGIALVESLDADHGGGALAGNKEVECVCAWVWTNDPDTVARAGTLLIQEPRPPTWQSIVHSDRRLTGCPTSAAGPPQMLAYPVIIHLDRVYDYSPAPATGSGTAGGVGGLLWPRCHVFSWRLGVLDGAERAPPPC